MTLYLPGPLLKPGLNTITLLELLRPNVDMTGTHAWRIRHLIIMGYPTVSFMLQPDFVTPPRRNGPVSRAPTQSYPEAHRRVWHASAASAA